MANYVEIKRPPENPPTDVLKAAPGTIWEAEVDGEFYILIANKRIVNLSDGESFTLTKSVIDTWALCQVPYGTEITIEVK